jgi:hypothetical protein
MRFRHLFLAACLLLSTLLAGCSNEKKEQVRAPEKAPASREALAIRDVGVPGLAYGFSWPQEPPYTVHYIPEPRFTITFNRPLAATQQMRPFYIQWGRYVDIYPEGSEDRFYGGPAGDTFQISGNELSIRAPHGGLPMGTVMVVIPRGWRASDGSALEEEQSFLVSQGAPTPHQAVSALVDSHDAAVDPLIWLPRSHAGPRIGYTIADETPVASAHGGPAERHFQQADSFVLEDEQRDGWQRITYYTRAPGAIQVEIPWSASIYEQKRLATPHAGWIPSARIRELPAPASPGSVAVVTRSNMFRPDSQPVAALNMYLPPAGWWSWPLDEDMNVTPAQLEALAFRAIPLWDDLPGLLHRTDTFQVNSEPVSSFDIRAHPVIAGLEPQQYDAFRRSQDRYVQVLLDILDGTRFIDTLAPYKQEALTVFRNRAALEKAWLDWIREDRMASAAQLVQRLRASGLQPAPGPELDQWFLAESGDGSGDGLRQAYARVLNRYGGQSLESVQLAFEQTWNDRPLVYEGPVRIREHRGDGLYTGDTEAHGTVWLVASNRLQPGKAYSIAGTLVLDREARSIADRIGHDWKSTIRPVLRVTQAVPKK